MPSFDSGTYDNQEYTRTNPTRLQAGNVVSSDVVYTRIPYTLAGSESAGDTINLCLLPAGAIPLPELSSIVCSGDPGTTLTVDIGTSADADGWCDGAVLSSGGQVTCTSAVVPAYMVAGELAEDTATPGNVKVVVTVASANTLTASTILYFILAYKLPK